MNPRLSLNTFQLLAASALWLGLSSPAVSQAPAGGEWPTPSLSLVASGLSKPIDIRHAGDGSGRLFVAELPGFIRIVSGGGLLPFLNISDRILIEDTGHGLLSLTFPPEFASKGYFYVAYTNLEGDTQISRFAVSETDPDQADPDSEQGVLTIDHPYPLTLDHWGGQLAFGPDGYLYYSMGDGDTAGAAQDSSLLLGKVLRIDVESDGGGASYLIPPDNPFVGVPGFREEIWASGLRNPWRLSFDRALGDLYLGDVGEFDYEEIDFQPASSGGGENYGWDILEGTHCFNPPEGCDPTGFTMPAWEYSHVDGCSVAGGTVYRGTVYPRMYGVYFYGDFCSGRVWGLRPSGSGWESALLLEAGFGLATFGDDEAGNLYLADFNLGDVYRIDDAITADGVMRSTAIRLVSRPLGSLHQIIGLVRLLDENNLPVSGALVRASWKSPLGSVQEVNATTGPIGIARLGTLGLAGTHTLQIIDVEKPGFIFDLTQSLLVQSITVPQQ